MTSARVKAVRLQILDILQCVETEQGAKKWLHAFNLNLNGKPWDLIVGSHGTGALTERVVEEARRVGKVCW